MSIKNNFKKGLNIRNLIIFSTLIFCINNISAAEGGPCKDYGKCDEFKYSLNDMASLQRGASTFLNYCYGCHSLQYSRWGRVATDLQIPEELFFENLVFDKSIKPGDLMTGSMSKEKSAQWFGVAPPDLTLVSRVRGDDWIYSYLRAYYEDSSKQYGVNNLVYPGTAMPNVLLALQGNQKLVCKDIPIIANNGGEKRAVATYSELNAKITWTATDNFSVSVAGRNLLQNHHLEYHFANREPVEIERSVYGRLVFRL